MAVHHPGMKQEIGDLMHTIRQMVTQAMQNASFGSAGLRVYGGGWITIENGGLSVTGTANVSGRLGGDGTFDWTGPWYLKGPGVISGNTDITGALSIKGDTDITGALSIKGKTSITGDTDVTGKLKVTGNAEFGGDTSIKKKLDVTAETRLRGKTTVEDDLIVTSDGKIKVGDMTIDPSAGQGKITFSNGAEIRAHDTGVTMIHGGSQVTVNGSRVMIRGGGATMELLGGRYYFDPASIASGSLPGAAPDTLFIGPGGLLCKVV